MEIHSQVMTFIQKTVGILLENSTDKEARNLFVKKSLVGDFMKLEIDAIEPDCE